MKTLIILLFTSITSYGQFGYQKENEFDTVKALMLITNCDTCAAKSITGYAIRQKEVYYGDRMPPLSYDDIWVIIGYLDSKRKPLKNVTIWISSLK